MAMDDESKLNCFTQNQLESVMCDVGANCSCDAAELSLFKQRVDFSTVDLQCKMKLIAALDYTEIETMDSTQLKNAVTSEYIKQAKIGAQQSRSILNKMDDIEYDKSTLTNLGELKAYMKSSHVAKIPEVDAEVIQSFGESFRDKTEETNPATRESFVEKALHGNLIQTLAESDMSEWLSVADFINARIEDFTNLVGDAGDVLIKCKDKAFVPLKDEESHALVKMIVRKAAEQNCKDLKDLCNIINMAFELYNKVTNVLGSPSSTNYNWTASRVRKFSKSCILCGMPVEDIQNLPEDKDLFDTLGSLDCLSSKQEIEISEKYKRITKVDGSATAPAYSTSEIKSAPPQILMRLSETELRRFGSSITKRLGKISLRTISKTEVTQKFDVYLSLKNKKTGTIDKDTLVDTGDGDLICGMTKSHLQRSDAGVVKKYLTVIMEKCLLDSTERSEIVQIALGKLGISPAQMTEKDLLVFGPGLIDFTENELNQIQDAELVKIKLKVAKMIKRKKKHIRKREKSSFTLEIADSEKTEFKNARKRFFKRMRTALRNTRGSRNSVGKRRRRRSTDTVTCDDLKGMEDIAPTLTTTQINNLNDNDFKNCLNSLGQITDYSDEQKEALANIGKRTTVYGSPSAWTEDTLISAGVIIQGLTLEEIATLQLTIDSVASLGRFDDWHASKKKAAVDRYLTLHKNGNTGTLNHTELRAFEHFACAMDTAQISSIQSTVYGNSADIVGEITSCEELQFLEYAKHAKQIYGALTGWRTSTISVVGVMIAGLTKSDIALLTRTQIEAISSVYIPYIPATTFSAFTTSQIQSFSQSQALATTNEQRSALNSEQFSALEEAARQSLTDPTSGCGGIMFTSCWIIPAIIMKLFLNY